MKLLLLLSAALSAAPSVRDLPAPARDKMALVNPPEYGILLLAHGGDENWNAELDRIRAQADQKVPTELALGMADPKEMQAALDRLAATGAKRAVAVPLFVHSRSEVMDQTKYVLGLSQKPSKVLKDAMERMMKAHARHAGAARPGPHRHHSFSLDRAKPSMPVSMTPALDDDPFVSGVLLERARALSKRPAGETVILVAHGPVDDAAVKGWDASLRKHAAAVKAGGGFKGAEHAMLRDDAAPEVRAAAVAALRAKVERAAKEGRALVVPVLIARGGIEKKIVRDLDGLDYAWSAETLLPHPGAVDWVLRRAAEAGSR